MMIQLARVWICLWFELAGVLSLTTTYKTILVWYKRVPDLIANYGEKDISDRPSHYYFVSLAAYEKLRVPSTLTIPNKQE